MRCFVSDIAVDAVDDQRLIGPIVAFLMNHQDHFGLDPKLDPLRRLREACVEEPKQPTAGSEGARYKDRVRSRADVRKTPQS